MEGNPYDGHTLADVLEKTHSLTGITPEFVYCNQGYRGAQTEGRNQSEYRWKNS